MVALDSRCSCGSHHLVRPLALPPESPSVEVEGRRDAPGNLFSDHCVADEDRARARLGREGGW